MYVFELGDYIGNRGGAAGQASPNSKSYYDYLENTLTAGCLIAFDCRESFKLESDYKGYLTFVSKTNLNEWYKKKYKSVQRMFISEENGLELIAEYLNRPK